MPNAPMGFWECAMCGDYVEDIYKNCPRCGVSKGSSVSQQTHTTSTQVQKDTNRPKIYDIENIGTSIQKASLVVLALSLLATPVCAIAFGRNRLGSFDFWIFLLILLVGGTASCINYMITNGFGSLIEDVGNVRADLRAIRQKLNEQEEEENL